MYKVLPPSIEVRETAVADASLGRGQEIGDRS
jgi:hypothetical protein